jgi:hypothetical protein
MTYCMVCDWESCSRYLLQQLSMELSELMSVARHESIGALIVVCLQVACIGTLLSCNDGSPLHEGTLAILPIYHHHRCFIMHPMVQLLIMATLHDRGVT